MRLSQDHCYNLIMRSAVTSQSKIPNAKLSASRRKGDTLLKESQKKMFVNGMYQIFLQGERANPNKTKR